MPNALGLTLKSIVFSGKMLPGMERTVKMLFFLIIVIDNSSPTTNKLERMLNVLRFCFVLLVYLSVVLF